MAKAKRPTVEVAKATHTTFRPVLQITDETPVYYVNHAEVSSSVYEIGLTVGRLPNRPSPEQFALASETGVLEAEAMLQVIFPPALLKGLIRALTLQSELYEAQFGPLLDVGATE